MTLPNPKNQVHDILYSLITKSGISERQTKYNAFRHSLSLLRKLLAQKNIVIRCAKKSFKNRFGHKNKYKIHYLIDGDKRKVVPIYRSLTNNK